jgi:predicted O-methyltransferase YrrM
MTMTETTVGSMNYNVLCNLLKTGNVIQYGRGAEVGVLYGDTSAYLLKEIPNLTLFSVDPYLPYDEPGHDRTAQTLSSYEQVAREKLRQFGDRSQIMKLYSVEAAPKIPDGSLDFVFIDALHTYEAVKEDIAAWFSKIRPGGLLTGHDYRWDGVQRAVHEFQQAVKLPGFFTPPSSDVWFFVKP